MLNPSFHAQTDSLKKKSRQPAEPLKKVTAPMHFFKTTVFLDYYVKPQVPLDTNKSFAAQRKVSKDLKTYGIVQSSISFYAPLLTINKFNKDSSINSNFHLLLAGTAYYLQPQFSGIAQHTLAKYGLGIRAIYKTGEKSIFFIESSPFMTQDITYGGDIIWRMSGTLLWSYSPNNKFNFRLGATKSFLWGNRYYLPFVGFRFGRLDKVNLSVQFPKNISLNFPIGNVFRLALYTKPQGGVFNFSNRDTVYNNKLYKNPNVGNDKTIHFGRYELLSGFRMDVMPTSWFSFYVSTGFSTRNYVAFYSTTFNKSAKKSAQYSDFYEDHPKGSLFLNAGLTFRIGRSKLYYNNLNMYEAHDINNTFDPGDNNVSPGNGDIPILK
ncbi:MAG: hypothetical protein ACXVDL_13665, partial [Bacteroidia bacterium]